MNSTAMKRLITIIIGLLAAGQALPAQEVLGRIAERKEGEMFSMYDVTVGRKGYSTSYSSQWMDDSHFLFREAGGKTQISTLEGELSEYTAVQDEARKAIDALNESTYNERVIHVTVAKVSAAPSESSEVAPEM